MKKTLIQHIEVGSGGAASITFSAIPADYDDLYLVLSARGTQSNPGYGRLGLLMALNGSSSNFTGRDLLGFGSLGTGSTTYSTSRLGWTDAADATANTFSTTSITIPNYTSSNYKSISGDFATENNNSGEMVLGIAANLWSVTTAISSITLSIESSNFAQYSSATLYGITAGSDGTTTVS